MELAARINCRREWTILQALRESVATAKDLEQLAKKTRGKKKVFLLAPQPDNPCFVGSGFRKLLFYSIIVFWKLRHAIKSSWDDLTSP
jgi:hypothetical protein